MESTNDATSDATSETKTVRKKREKKPVDPEMKCAKEGCSYKKSENAYCGKHQAIWFLESTESEGKKVCVNYIRGCRAQLDPEYKKSRCEECLKKDRTKDQARRKEKVEVEEGMKRCTACLQEFELESFQGTRGATLTCKVCRDANKRADLARDKEHVRELGRKNSAKPERIEVKKEWKEKNYEKVASYWIDARKRLIESDLEGYLKKNAEISKHWREINPEKVAEMNQLRNEDVNYHYQIYKRSAMIKILEFTITEEEYLLKVVNPCYYCRIIQEKGFNGLDRLDSTIGYTLENIVSCCQMCNMMKGSLGPTIFIHRCEHILTNVKILEGKLYPDEFPDTKGSSYSHYTQRALKKNLPFELSRERFQDKCKEPCYLCGKIGTETHQNGIDRFDNLQGYTEENTRSCCSECNYLKRDYPYEAWIQQLTQIYQENSVILSIEDQSIKHVVPGNKLSKEELQLQRKSAQIHLIESYTNPEKRQERIEKIMKNRK